jgi:hypothetical protein
MRHTFPLRLFVAALALSGAASAQQQSAENKPRWLWVKDYAAGVGVASRKATLRIFELRIPAKYRAGFGMIGFLY